MQSHLSPHGHYGQISVIYLTYRALCVARGDPREPGSGRDESAPPDSSYRPSPPPSPALRRGVDKYLDELVIRRELAVTFVLHEPRYDRYEGVPQWARRSLAEHAGDARKHVYTLEQFEACQTHDALWNAAQRGVDEAKLSRLASTRAYLHAHIYRPETLYAQWGEVLEVWGMEHAAITRRHHELYLQGERVAR